MLVASSTWQSRRDDRLLRAAQAPGVAVLQQSASPLRGERRERRPRPRPRLFHGLAALLLALLASAASDARAQTDEAAIRRVVPVEGRPFPAALLSVERGWKIAFRSGKTTRSLSAGEIVKWGSPREIEAGPQLLLVDGGRLAAEILAGDQRQLKIDSELFGTPNIPLELVAGIVFRPPVDLRRRDRLLARLSSAASFLEDRGDEADASAPPEPLPRQNADRLILENGDELTGTMTSIDGAKLQFESEAGPVEIELDRVAAIKFNPSLLSTVRPRGLHCLVGFSDSSRLAAASLELDAGRARVSLAGSFELSSDAGAVVFLQSFGGQAIYLSDLKSESYRHVPYLKLSWPYERDASVGGSRLRAGGRMYLKGIGMHSASRLTYRLDGSARRFAAEAAVDDETQGRGSVVFRVFVDDREIYKSPPIRGGMPPAPVSVDVQGGKRLSLIVDFGERGDELDHADWLDARLLD